MAELHRGQFVKWEPASIVSFSCSPNSTLIALARDDGTIEIYSAQGSDHLDEPIHSIAGDDATTLSSIVFVSETPMLVATASLEGFVKLWQPHMRMQPVKSVDSCGGAVWQVSTHSKGTVHSLAAACDDGSIRIFSCDISADPPSLELDKSMSRASGRCLSCAWLTLPSEKRETGHPRLAAGTSDGAVIISDVESKQEVSRIGVGGAGKVKAHNVRVWCLAPVLGDQGAVAVASGDSEGRTSIWDYETATLIGRANAHSADVMSMGVARSGRMLVSGSADGDLSVMERATVSRGFLGPAAPPTKSFEWHFTARNHTHRRDIKAVLTANCARSGDKVGAADPRGDDVAENDDEVIVSGGNDATVAVHTCKSIRGGSSPIGLHYQTPPPMCLSEENGMLASALGSRISLWQLPSARDKEKRGSHPMSESAKELASIDIENGEHASSIGISSGGRFVAFSSASGTRVLSATRTEETDAVACELTFKTPLCSKFVSFCGEDSLVVCRPNGQIDIVDAITGVTDATLAHRRCTAEKTVTFMECNGRAGLLALVERGAGASTASIVSVTGGERLITVKDREPRAITLDKKGETAYVVLRDGSVAGYSVEDGSRKEGEGEKEEISLPPERMRGKKVRLTLSCGWFLLSSSNAIFCFKGGDEAQAEGGQNKRKREGRKGKQGNQSPSTPKLVDFDDVLLFAAPLDENRLLVVERRWSDALATKAQPIYRHKYGT